MNAGSSPASDATTKPKFRVTINDFVVIINRRSFEGWVGRYMRPIERFGKKTRALIVFEREGFHTVLPFNKLRKATTEEIKHYERYGNSSHV